MGDKRLRNHGRNFRMVSIVTMENYYDSGWHMGNSSWAQCSDHSSSSFAVPIQILPHHVTDSASLQFGEFHSWPLPIEGAAEERAISASKSHSQAEKRRRDRINAQLATLRKLIPKSDKVNQFLLHESLFQFSWVTYIHSSIIQEDIRLT